MGAGYRGGLTMREVSLGSPSWELEFFLTESCFLDPADKSRLGSDHIFVNNSIRGQGLQIFGGELLSSFQVEVYIPGLFAQIFIRVRSDSQTTSHYRLVFDTRNHWGFKHHPKSRVL